MEFSSYDDLLKQVDNLRVENSNLRKELEDNSNHLCKLENEASTMKEVLTHLHDRMDSENEQMATETTRNGIPDNRQSNGRCIENDLSEHNPGSLQAQVVQLERERTRILQDIEVEEKEKQWFLACMERINQQLLQLSHDNGYSTQADNTLKQQLERDAECLRETMQQKLGTRGEMHRREEARIHSICLIEKEIKKLYQQQDNSDDYVNCDLDSDLLNEKSMTDLCEESESIRCGQSGDLKMSSKMTTSATQTMDMFASESTSPPPPTSDEDVSNLASIYHGSWPLDKVLWHSGPSSLGGPTSINSFHNHDTGSVASFKSNTGLGASYRSRSNTQQLGTKVEMVYSLLSMLGSHDKDDMSRKLLSMSSSVDSCIAMRQSGCLPLLVELLHGDDKDGETERRRPTRETRQRASQALHNVVHSHPDDKRGRREARVLRLLEQIRDYCGGLRDCDSGSDEDQTSPEAAVTDKHPIPAMAMLMKLSFDEEHRHAMCQLGGLQAIAELVQVDYDTHGNLNDQYCITLRRYAGMALTNLTFGDGTNKALLCSMRPFMRALVAQLHSPSEDLRQVIASVVRNLSWRADQASKKTLREVGAVATLMRASMDAKKESTLKSILSALWNLSAHCSMNKAEICAVEGALAFLVGTLTYKSPSNTHAIVENGGGILRNISSHIAVREDYRCMLRQHNCLQILLQHLRSPSLTIVSNACGTLWNLSARCTEDQQSLWDMGAVGMLRNLVHSKHKMISMGSSAALKNLLAAKPGGLASSNDKFSKSGAPSLLVRKQKALEAELDHNLAETCENLDSPKTSPTHHRSEGEPRFNNFRGNLILHNQAVDRGCYPLANPYQLHGRMYHSVGGQLPPKHVARSESKDSIVSTQSDSSHDRLGNLNILLRHRQEQGACHERLQSSLVGATPDVLESRIQYVMKEVTRQIALENEIIKNEPSMKGTCYLKPSSTLSKVVHGQLHSTPDSDKLVKPSVSNNVSSPDDGTPNSHQNTIYDKYSNLTSMIENMNLDDSDSSYQPVDYSLKYSEESSQSVGNNRLSESAAKPRLVSKIDNHISNKLYGGQSDSDQTHRFVKSTLKQTNVDWQGTKNQLTENNYKRNAEPIIYGNYAETDLDGPDQPTNFSLRYTEDTDTTDAFQAPAPQEGSPYLTHEYGAKEPSFHDDTMMTYCTEDTPLNFSTATSLSDLRDLKEVNAPISKIQRDKKDTAIENCSKDTRLKNEDSSNNRSGSRCSDVEKPPSSVSSIDKPVTYCVEDTPGCLSRLSPLSSIHSTEASEQHYDMGDVPSDVSREFGDKDTSAADEEDVFVKVEEEQNAEDCRSPNDIATKTEMKGSEVQKTVTFGEDHFAEETPLMFSRCSSLGSLSSFDQQSIHDDRSSVISDFSRRASEVVSPSDLPDSPGQTCPSSPRPSRAPVTFTSKIPRESTLQSRFVRPVPAKKTTPAVDTMNSVFEDAPCVYLDEGTPLEFSKGTSLSSLPFGDDSVESTDDHGFECIDENTKDDDEDDNKTDSPESSPSDNYEELDSTSPVDEPLEKDTAQEKGVTSEEHSDDEDNDILAACINSAMPNNSRHSKLKHNNTKLSSKLNVLGSSGRLRGSFIPVKSNNLKLGCPPPLVPQGSSASCTPSTPNSLCKPNNKLHGGCSNALNPNEYNIKASESGVRGHDSSSDTSSVFDDDPEKILAQCIRSGMPKSNLPGNGRHAGNLLERKFDDCSGISDKAHYNKSQFCHVSPQPRHGTMPHTATKLREQLTAEDTLTVFAEEGTPANISNATSLSNLTIDSVDVGHDIKPFECMANKTADVDNQNNWQQRSKINNGRDFANSSKSSNQSSCAALGTIQEGGAKACNVAEPMISNDTLKQYAEEGTPSCLSRGFSLSSLSIADTDASGRDSCDAVCGGGDTSMQFPVEDTPACFSQNSSLSSLSVESLCIEPSPLEQALLEECISSGMPKSYSSFDNKQKHKSRKPRGSLLPCAVGGRDRHMSHSKGVTKMECVVEKPMSPTPESNNEEESDGSSLIPTTMEKNWQCTAVATDDPIDTAAGSTEKVDIAAVNIDAISSDDHSASSTAIRVVAGDEEQNEIEKHVSDSTVRQDSEERKNVEVGSLLILMEATKVAVEVQKEVRGLSEEMEQSLVSQSSDIIDNVNPPSVMGDLLSCSMVSSGASDSVGRKSSLDSAPVVHSLDQQQVGRGSRFTCQRSKVVPELVMRALADGVTGGNIVKQQSMDGSIENLSVRSNAISDIIDNVKPPSIMEDLDMASSTYSVCSIVSEVADSKSEGISNDDGSVGSDVMFKCLKSVVAMAEMYARDSNMVASGRSGFSVSEIIENVNPPSTLLEITDSMKECTEVATDTLENNNDTDVEDDLPADPEPLQAWDESPEEQLSDEDNVKQFEEYDVPKNEQLRKNKFKRNSYMHSSDADINEQQDLDITPEEILVLREDANLVLSTLNELQLQDYSAEESLFDDLIECETLSLVSNGSDSLSSDRSESRDSGPNSPIIQQGPRIIKPVNKDSIRWNSNNQEEKAVPKGIRGKRKSLYPRQQIISSCSNTRFSSLTKKEMVVKPTRTSALRATQSQQKVTTGSRFPTECAPTRSPSLRKISPPNDVKVVRPLGKIIQNGNPEDVPNCSDGKQGSRPKPPIKQGTFTKEKPSQNSPPKISPSKTRIPTFGRTSSSVEHQAFQPSKEERPPHGATGRATSRSKLTVSRSLDDSNSTQRIAHRSVTKVVNNEPKTVHNNRVLSRRGQSSSPVQRSLSNSIGSARNISSIGVRNSPSTHSLGSTGSNSKRNVPLNNQVSLLNGSLCDAKRSSSNGSLCSNTSSSTSNSRKSFSGCSVVKKDVKSKVSSLWKSSGKGTKMSSSAEVKAATPKEGLSRSSTYEKLPTFECSLIPHHSAEEGSEPQNVGAKEKAEITAQKDESTSKSSFVKKGTRALAEARLQKWLARKARLVAKRDAEASQDSDEPSELSGIADEVVNEITSPVISVAGLAQRSSSINLDGGNELQVTNNCNGTETKVPAAAIVTPFNYTPSSHIPVSVSRSSGKAPHRSLIPMLNHVAVSPTVRQQDACFRIGETNKIEDSKQPSLVSTA